MKLDLLVLVRDRLATAAGGWMTGQISSVAVQLFLN